MTSDKIEVTTEDECLNCGYPYIDISYHGKCPRCGCNNVLAKVTLEEKVNLTDKLSTERRFVLVNPEIQATILCVTLFAIILSVCIQNYWALIFGILLDIFVYYIGKSESENVIERDHY